MVRRTLLLRAPAACVSLAVLALAGCSGGSSNPLLGSWEGAHALPTGLSIDYQFTFHPDNTLEVDDTVAYPATGFTMPGCTEQDQAVGFTWSISRDGGVPIISINQSQVQQATVYTNCADPDDDEAEPASANETVLSGSVLEVVSFSYEIMGNTLTLTPVGGPGIGVVALMRH